MKQTDSKQGTPTQLRVGFALEYSLGHVTHAENLKRFLTPQAATTPTYVDLPFANTPGWWSRLPAIRSNWSLRASLGAFLGLRRAGPFDALFFHTQVTSLCSTELMRRVPAVVSLDATPAQYDRLGVCYGHSPSRIRSLEKLKRRLNLRAFSAARQLVTWSAWTKQSLVEEYGQSADKITVIPPGINTAQWSFPRREQADGPLRLLFVGGDFYRKGGDLLLEAFRQLPVKLQTELHIVTKTAEVAANIPRVFVHRTVTPHSNRLLELYRQADLFVFPTRGDCLPLAVMEALAAGLPVISTDVGALSEAVVDGVNGLLIPKDDARALTSAISSLLEDRKRCAEMGARARQVALERFDAGANYGRLLELLKSVADQRAS